jgi:DNA-directed RNA polymerase subunit RPC12/RpoP
MLPICAECNRSMRPEKNGVTVEELMDDGSPYKLWKGDRYICPECTTRVIVGIAEVPLAEHYQEGYSAMKQAFPPDHKVR